MTRPSRHLLALALLLVAGACTRPPPPAPPAPLPSPEPPAPPPPAWSYTQAWARQPGLPLRADTLLASSQPVATVPHAAMRLDVLQVDTPRASRLQVRCAFCPGRPTGWVSTAEVVYQPAPPEAARQGDLAEFVLAVREAAVRRDVAALRAVMAGDFVHSFEGGEGILEAVNAWERHRYNDLVFLPGLLDRGVVPLPGTVLWAAPPEFATQPGYRDLRAGFRKGPAGWEWLFLVRPGP
ncbi:MAG TPA: hypothetical protein VFX98_06500 [Longimicrobiaceae bacterium]|nr:hypothetical protein [Longimicrobiaceae bacterium]